jgi:hypothetical protein
MRTGSKIILGAALLVLLLIVGKFFLSEVSFSPANPYWDGASCVMTADTRPLYSFDGLPPGDSSSTLLIVGPTASYTPADASRVRDFLQQGGRVVVMDDFGTANDLLSNISSPVAIEHTALCQDLEYYRKPSFPIVGRIANSSLTENVSQLVFNHPAPLQITGEAEVLAWTTIMGWLDVEGTSTISGDEKFSSYPLIARAAYGNGELFVVGDADLAINAMQDQGDDGVLIGNVLRSDTVYMDVAHGQQVPPLAWLFYTIKYNLVVQILFALLIFLLGYACVARSRSLRLRREPEAPKADSRDALIASMKARLPLSDREIEELKKKL